MKKYSKEHAEELVNKYGWKIVIAIWLSIPITLVIKILQSS